MCSTYGKKGAGHMSNLPTYVPSERDILVGLIDAVMSLSERLFPGERMLIKLIASEPDREGFATIGAPTLTSWVPR